MKSKSLKTTLIMGQIIGLSAVVSAGLVDGGFEATGSLGATPVGTGATPTQTFSLYNQTEPDGVTTLDQGWYSGNPAVGNISQQGGGDKYAELGTGAGWNKDDRFWIGQMFTDNVVSGNQFVSFEVVASDYTDANTQTLVVAVYTVPNPTSDSAKLKLASDISSFVELGRQTVDISGGIGTYSTGEIDFSAASDLYAISIQVYSKDGSGTLVGVGGPMGLDNVVISDEPVEPPGPPPASSVALIDPGFEAVDALSAVVGAPQNGLYNTTNSYNSLDLGWFAGKVPDISQQGTVDKYAEFGTGAGWNKADRFWIGQMFTSTNATGEQKVSFDIVADAYTDPNTQSLEIEIWSIPDFKQDFAKLRLDSTVSSYTLLGSQTVDISAGSGAYISDAIDFTAESDIYAIRIQSYSKDGSDLLVNVAGTMGLDNIAIDPAVVPLPTNATVSIVSISSVSSNVMELVVSSDNPFISYPKSKTDLTLGLTWDPVAHSTNGLPPFVVTNLSYSAASGTNYVIYVKADEPAEFFDFGSE